jgi:hypothetical protein
MVSYSGCSSCCSGIRHTANLGRLLGLDSKDHLVLGSRGRLAGKQLVTKVGGSTCFTRAVTEEPLCLLALRNKSHGEVAAARRSQGSSWRTRWWGAAEKWCCDRFIFEDVDVALSRIVETHG